MIEKMSDVLKEVPRESFAVKLIQVVEFEQHYAEHYAEHLVDQVNNQKTKPIFNNEK